MRVSLLCPPSCLLATLINNNENEIAFPQNSAEQRLRESWRVTTLAERRISERMGGEKRRDRRGKWVGRIREYVPELLTTALVLSQATVTWAIAPGDRLFLGGGGKEESLFRGSHS